MDRRTVLALSRAAFGLLAVVAIAVQMATNIGAGTFNPTRFFAFFTILSNVFGAGLLLILAARWRTDESRAMELLRGASVVYLTVTFFVVIFLLSGADLQLAIPWVDVVLHKILPVVVVIDWLVDQPTAPLSLRDGLRWLIFPVVWVVFTLVRGAVEGWYPYPFLDPANGGYGSVAMVSAAILVGFVVICALTVAAGNAMAGRRTASQRAT